MSDHESYNSDSENENSDDELEVTKINKNVKFNVSPNIDSYKEDEDEEEKDEEEKDEEDDEEKDDEEKDDNEEKDEDDNEEKDVEDEDLEDEDLEDAEDEDDAVDVESSSFKKDPPKKGKKIIKPLQTIITDDDDELDDDYDDNYLQKFDNEITKNYINEFHPECLNHNYDEISNMTRVVRDSTNIIIDPFHATIPFLTKYEKAKVLGQRAKQIETGAKPLVNVPDNVVDSYLIAELELQQKKIPFIIRRPIPGGGCEYWNIKDLEMIAF